MQTLTGAGKSRDDEIIEDIKRGLTNRKLQTKWHKNPNQLKELRLRAEGKQPTLPPSVPAQNGPSEGEVAAAAFKIFDKGLGPVAAVKRLKLVPDVANGLYAKYAEMKGIRLIPRSIWKRLAEISSRAGHGRPADVPALEQSIRNFADDQKQLQVFTYACKRCDESMLAGETEWRDILYGQRGTTGDGQGHLDDWGHEECARLARET